MYLSVIIFTTYFEHIFCWSTTTKRQMQKDDTICLGECNSYQQLLIPAGSECSTGVPNKGQTNDLEPSFLLKSQRQMLKTENREFPKELLGSRNKIKFPIRFANTAMNVLWQFLPRSSLQPCTNTTQFSCLNSIVSRKPQKSDCIMLNSV